LETDKLYHIYTHANGNENLFRNDENYRYFLKRYQEFISPVATTYAWCLMPNHLHLLVKVKSEKEVHTIFSTKFNESIQHQPDLLSKNIILQFSHLFNAYSKAYNKFYNRRGSLFMRAFKRKEIVDDSYLTSVILYIHRNPLHHGFVTNLTDWKWSSYTEFLMPTLKPDQQYVIDWFGNKEEFVKLHQQTQQLTHLTYD
jgi:putative transposase